MENPRFSSKRKEEKRARTRLIGRPINGSVRESRYPRATLISGQPFYSRGNSRSAKSAPRFAARLFSARKRAPRFFLLLLFFFLARAPETQHTRSPRAIYRKYTDRRAPPPGTTANYDTLASGALVRIRMRVVSFRITNNDKGSLLRPGYFVRRTINSDLKKPAS